MTNEKFEIIVNDCIESIKKVLLEKAKDYATEDDRLHNFKFAGRIAGISPERALMGFKLKHDVSVQDIVNDLDGGKLPVIERVKEKIGDCINYLILLEALIIERLMDEQMHIVFPKFKSIILPSYDCKSCRYLFTGRCVKNLDYQNGKITECGQYEKK
jgi:hypothetical protein